jgi:hypothetical protein
MKQIKLLDREYSGFESYGDLLRDVEEAVAEAPIPGEYEGSFKVVLIYEGDDIEENSKV